MALDILSRFPTEILEHIALQLILTTNQCLLSHLTPLLLTNRALHARLSLSRSTYLSARIFLAKFDVGAVHRRTGPRAIRTGNLAVQLHVYAGTLREIRRGDIYHPDILDILRNAYFMAMEDDGRNGYQLEKAGLADFVDRFVRARLLEGADHGGRPVSI